MSLQEQSAEVGGVVNTGAVKLSVDSAVVGLLDTTVGELGFTEGV